MSLEHLISESNYHVGAEKCYNKRHATQLQVNDSDTGDFIIYKNILGADNNYSTKNCASMKASKQRNIGFDVTIIHCIDRKSVV